MPNSASHFSKIPGSKKLARFKEYTNGDRLFIVLIIFAGLLLFFLGGSELKAWRAVQNNKREVSKYEVAIRAELQTPVNQECAESGGHATLFNITTTTEKTPDGSVKKRFGIAQFTCDNNPSIPARFAAIQSYDNGATWQFTYGSSIISPNTLLAYIYDTNPALFKKVYDNPIRK